MQQKGYNDVVTSNSNSTADRFDYNGKEHNPELGLNWHDYGARNYDASLGRFNNIDEYAQNYMSYSPYSYVLDNPINNIDYKGKFVLPKEFANGRLAHYLANNIQDILKNDRVVNALKKWGGFSDEQLQESFTYGEGPVINVEQLGTIGGKEILGLYTGGSSFAIDIDLFEALENAEGKDRDYLLFLTAVTILHEFTHLGYNNNGLIDQNGTIDFDDLDLTIEEGTEFEIAAYGKRIAKSKNYEELLDKWINKKKEESEKKTKAFNNLLDDFDELENGKYKYDGNDFIKVDE